MKRQPLIDLLGPVVQDLDLELADLEIVPAGRRKLLRVVLDGDGPAGHGPDLDQLTAASRAISAALDAGPVVGEAPYTLEVTTRGVGRPLTKPAHYRRNVGRLLDCELVSGEHLSGRILSADEAAVTLEVDATQQVVAFVQLAKAVIQVELNRPVELSTDFPECEIAEEN